MDGFGAVEQSTRRRAKHRPRRYQFSVGIEPEPEDDKNGSVQRADPSKYQKESRKCQRRPILASR